MLNLIPAILLLLVNGPVGPLAETALPGHGPKVLRDIGSDPARMAAIFRLALQQVSIQGRAQVFRDSTDVDEGLSPRTTVHNTGFGDPSDALFRTVRLRDGPRA